MKKLLEILGKCLGHKKFDVKFQGSFSRIFIKFSENYDQNLKKFRLNIIEIQKKISKKMYVNLDVKCE